MKIEIDLVRQLVASQFPRWAHLPVRPVEVDGWDNRTFRLGDDLSVRLPSGADYALQVDKEQQWLPVLAPQLPLPIPTPVARGEPGDGYPYPWSVYRWLDGRPAAAGPGTDLGPLAADLATFLVALRDVDARHGPPPGPHNFHRGGGLDIYADETWRALEALGDEVDQARIGRLVEEALASSWTADPVWVHGDVAAGNLLVRQGQLAAVIDFGCCGVGDPACDLVIAWTMFSVDSRAIFRQQVGLDPDTWARGRGWALWKALITFVGDLESRTAQAPVTRGVIEAVVQDADR